MTLKPPAAGRKDPSNGSENYQESWGGLMSYSADFFQLWRRAAGYVDRILRRCSPAPTR